MRSYTSGVSHADTSPKTLYCTIQTVKGGQILRLVEGAEIWEHLALESHRDGQARREDENFDGNEFGGCVLVSEVR